MRKFKKGGKNAARTGQEKKRIYEGRDALHEQKQERDALKWKRDAKVQIEC